MSLPHTRKSFFAKLIGLVAAVGTAPRLLARPLQTISETPVSAQVPFALRPDKRAIARSSDSL